MNSQDIDTSTVFGVENHKVTKIYRMNIIEFTVNSKELKLKIISYANIFSINIASSLEWFKIFLNISDIVFWDGFGIKIMSEFIACEMPERFTSPDWMKELADLCEEKDFSLFLLGANTGIAKLAASNLKVNHPKLIIGGVQHGYFNKDRDHQDNIEVVKLVNETNCDILIVGMGMPLQEKWIKENVNEINVSVIIPVGAMFDYVTGNVWRAPNWITDFGLEWLARLIVEPKRLWKRYIFGNPLFFPRIFLQ